MLAERPDGLTAVEIAEAPVDGPRRRCTPAAHARSARPGHLDGARYFLGFGVADLARRLQPRLQSVAAPLLHRLSIQTDSTALAERGGRGPGPRGS
jgi:hypothetical protein